MYIYRLNNFDYEDSVTIELQHETKFTKKEFSKLVNKCLIEAKKELKKNLKIICNENKTEEEKEKNVIDNLFTKNDIIPRVIEKLKNEYGFSEIEPIYTFVFTKGSYGIEPTIFNDCL